MGLLLLQKLDPVSGEGAAGVEHYCSNTDHCRDYQWVSHVGYLSIGFSIHVIYLSSYPYVHHGPLLLSVSCRLFPSFYCVDGGVLKLMYFPMLCIDQSVSCMCSALWHTSLSI